MRRQKKPTFAINIRFSHFAPLISLPRTLFAARIHYTNLPQPPIPVRGRCFLACRHYNTRYSGLNGSTMHCCK